MVNLVDMEETAMRQQTLADSGFEKLRKKTRKERFLNDMKQVIPLQKLSDAINTVLPEARRSRRTAGGH